MADYYTQEIPRTDRIPRLVAHLYAKMPEIESARARLITESYKATEDKPVIMRRAMAFAHILDNIPIIIREGELIVGSTTIAPRGCQTYPEFSYKWLEAEFDTVAARKADPFYIAEQTKKELLEADAYWEGKTTSELATSLMTEETRKAIEHNMFTPGNYFYNGVGHVTVQYDKVLAIGYEGILAQVEEELGKCNPGDADYCTRSQFLQAAMPGWLSRRQAPARILPGDRNCSRLPPTARRYLQREPPPSMKPVRVSGSSSSFCRLSPAAIPFLLAVLTSTCIPIIRMTWMQGD